MVAHNSWAKVYDRAYKESFGVFYEELTEYTLAVAKEEFPKGLKIIERKIKPEEMSNFVGCFLTGTAAEITPVSQIDNYKFTVCEVIKSLSESYINLVRKKVAA